MNIFLQQGVCISPPFPRNETACLSPELPSNKNGYHHELHYFENFDYTKVIPHALLVDQHRQRHERIKNCSHTWPEKEMQEIFSFS